MGDHVSGRGYVVAHLPGDGVGPEVTQVARHCVDAAGARRGFTVDWRHCPLGAKHFLATGEVLREEEPLTLSELQRMHGDETRAVTTEDSNLAIRRQADYIDRLTS